MQIAADTKVHVFNEIAPLRQVMVWGEPGCEALLGQLLPKSLSLALSYYQVPEARLEFRRMQALIEEAGVRVIRMKDAYASMLKEQSLPGLTPTLAELKKKLVERADDFFEAFQREKAADLLADGSAVTPEQVYLQVKGDISKILSEDVRTYGEQTAIKLNYMLSLSEHLPIANIVYGRDQSNALGDKIVMSIMRWKIRRPEVEIYEKALRHLGYGDALVHIDKGTLEGGDSIIFGDTCYIGVGARTSMEAVIEIYARIGARLEQNGIQVVAVVNDRHAEESPAFTDPSSEHMQVMHLDTFWIPLDEKTVLASGVELDNRTVLRVTQKDGTIATEELGGFRQYLTGRGLEIMEVTEQEQKDYATNLLNLGGKRVIVPLSRNERVITALEGRGFRVHKAELLKLVGGYGAVHCLTAPVMRE